MSYDAFISWSRADSNLAAQVHRLLEERLRLRVFRDVESLPPGQDWREELTYVLSHEDTAYIVVLCTTSAGAKPKAIQKEIGIARSHSKTIICLAIDEGSVQLLVGDRRSQFIALPGGLDETGSLSAEQLLRLEGQLRLAITNKVRRWLDEERIKCRRWAEERTFKPSFWEGESRANTPLSQLQSTVYLAEAGSGKSTHLAEQVLAWLAEDPKTACVLIDEKRLQSLGDPTATVPPEHNLVAALGARDQQTFAEHVQMLTAKNSEGRRDFQIVFVVDGLDQMVIPGDAHQSALKEGLNRLLQAGPVCVGCRTAVWNDLYDRRLSLRKVIVPTLDQSTVEHVLRSARFPSDKLAAAVKNPLLRIPLFLDWAVRRGKSQYAISEQRSVLLNDVLEDAVSGGSVARDPLVDGNDRKWWLDAIARWQLDHLLYDVPLRELRSRSDYRPELEHALAELQSLRIIQQASAREDDSTIRLRHDLLDNHSMCRVLFAARDALGFRRALQGICERCGEDCGWSLLSSVVRMLHDRGRLADLEILFHEFLFILDRKKFSSDFMNRSWSVTHVLKENLDILLDLVLDALEADPVPSLDKSLESETPRVASQIRERSITQEAASTLASAFLVLSEADVANTERVVSVMAANLGKPWSWRGRFVDALGMFRTPAALTAIIQFGKRQLAEGGDVEALQYVAANLRHFRDTEAEALLLEMWNCTDLPLSIRRTAAESLHRINPNRTHPEIPPLTTAEVTSALATTGKGSVQYSDWQQIHTMAKYLRAAKASGEFSHGPEVLGALIAALDHDQTFARVPVAQALGQFDEDEARDALTLELLEPTLPREVRDACLESLKVQYKRLQTPTARQRFRCVLALTAISAEQIGRWGLRDDLRSLCTEAREGSSTALLGDPEAMEVMSLAEAGSIQANQKEVQAFEIDDRILDSLDRMSVGDVGPDLEPKYRIATLQSLGRSIAMNIVQSTWSTGRRFHVACEQSLRTVLTASKRWMLPAPLGNVFFPGIASVHVLVLTADDQLLVAQRTHRSAYYPSHWSTSFEEGLTSADWASEHDPFQIAAARGFEEEFGAAVRPEAVRLLSVVLEVRYCNLAVVALIQSPENSANIVGRWKSQKSADEVQRILAVEASTAEQLAGYADNPRLLNAPLHPTSAIRLQIAARWFRQAKS